MSYIPPDEEKDEEQDLFESIYEKKDEPEYNHGLT